MENFDEYNNPNSRSQTDQQHHDSNPYNQLGNLHKNSIQPSNNRISNEFDQEVVDNQIDHQHEDNGNEHDDFGYEQQNSDFEEDETGFNEVGGGGGLGDAMGLEDNGLTELEMDMMEHEEADQQNTATKIKVFITFDEDDDNPKNIDLNKLFKNENNTLPFHVEVSLFHALTLRRWRSTTTTSVWRWSWTPSTSSTRL